MVLLLLLPPLLLLLLLLLLIELILADVVFNEPMLLCRYNEARDISVLYEPADRYRVVSRVLQRTCVRQWLDRMLALPTQVSRFLTHSLTCVSVVGWLRVNVSLCASALCKCVF